MTDPIAPTIEQALYRIAQEALSNVARHSHATAVTLTLDQNPLQPIMTIRDNGVGLPVEGAQGIGLQSMQERVAALHGTFEIASAPEHGTTVTAHVPGMNLMNEPTTLCTCGRSSNGTVGAEKLYFDTLEDIQVVGEAGTGKEAVESVTQLAPDVVLIDLYMPDMDGVEATRAVKAHSPRTQVIILTSYHADEHIFPAIRAGALLYVLKDIDPDELADAVRRAHEGEAVLNPRVAARMVQEISGTCQEAVNPFHELTEREMQVLRLIANGQNNREIAAALVISDKTVKSHISNILSKLHLADRTQAAVYAWQAGIVRRNNQV